MNRSYLMIFDSAGIDIYNIHGYFHELMVGQRSYYAPISKGQIYLFFSRTPKVMFSNPSVPYTILPCIYFVQFIKC